MLYAELREHGYKPHWAGAIMRIDVRVKTRSKAEKVTQLDRGRYEVAVNSPPVDGQANERVIELLSEHFNVPKSRVILIRGHRGKNKIFELS